MARKRWVGIGLGALASSGLVAGSLSHRLPLDAVEVLGFVTGVLSVWLIVEESVWNWPVNIGNNLVYAVVFTRAGLVADTVLQLACVGFGVLGWYRWRRAGDGEDGLRVSRTGARRSAVLGGMLGAGTLAAAAGLAAVGDAAPFPDALAAGLTVLAQYLLTRKLVGTWWVSIAATAIYSGLYAWRGMDLTAALYVVFLAFSVAGLLRWRKLLARRAWPSAVPGESSQAAGRPAPRTHHSSPRAWSSSPAAACSCWRS